MYRCLLLITAVLLSSCTTFDKTNIQPGQKVEGLGFSFSVPENGPWFAVVWGNSNRMKLSQLNDDDSFSVEAALNRGPRSGMFPSAESHLRAVQGYLQNPPRNQGFMKHQQETWIDNSYGELCIRYRYDGENWYGRNKPGPAVIKVNGLTCPHKTIKNTLLRLELKWRHERGAKDIDLNNLAEQMFASLQYHSIN